MDICIRISKSQFTTDKLEKNEEKLIKKYPLFEVLENDEISEIEKNISENESESLKIS